MTCLNCTHIEKIRNNYICNFKQCNMGSNPYYNEIPENDENCDYNPIKTDLTKWYDVKEGSKEYLELEKITKEIIIFRKYSKKNLGNIGDTITIKSNYKNNDGFYSINYYAIIKSVKKLEKGFLYDLERIPDFPHWLKIILAKL